MKKMSQVLRETVVNQIHHDLIRYDDNNNVVGKCALGVLACESGDPSLKLDGNSQDVSYDNIIKAYKTNLDEGLPYLYRESGSFDFSINMTCTLSDYIYKLNDSGLSFKEIADFLETNLGL
jgi:hypothetical protein